MVPGGEAREVGAGIRAAGLQRPGELGVGKTPHGLWRRCVVIPDVMALDNQGHLRGAPELVIEVLSPGVSNERRDRQTKLKLYSRPGVGILDCRLDEAARRSPSPGTRRVTHGGHALRPGRAGISIVAWLLLPGR